MRWVSLPEELALPHLLELGDYDLSTVYRDLFLQVLTRLRQGQLHTALALSEQAYASIKGDRDRYGQSLALVLRAEVLRRLQRWEESLDAIRGALRWLELRGSPVACYNEAVAVYLEGIIHCTLRADEKVLETFAYAQEALVDRERYWGFEHHDMRVADCRNVIRWMSGLLDLLHTTRSDEPVMILPVYEFVNTLLIRTDVVAFEPYQVMVPAQVLAPYLPDYLHPVQLDTLSVLNLRPQTTYIGVRIPEDGYMVRQGCKGDLLIVEATTPRPAEAMTPQSAEGTLMLTSDKPFIRRRDGRVEFRPALPGVPQSTRGWVGIPRLLIREQEVV
jgi:hypothetical protein